MEWSAKRVAENASDSMAMLDCIIPTAYQNECRCRDEPDCKSFRVPPKYTSIKQRNICTTGASTKRDDCYRVSEADGPQHQIHGHGKYYGSDQRKNVNGEKKACNALLSNTNSFVIFHNAEPPVKDRRNCRSGNEGNYGASHCNLTLDLSRAHVVRVGLQGLVMFFQHG